MAKTTGSKRIALQLDPRVAFEALILNRLERIPETRRQEWLRGLLVQGFRQECQSLRVVQDEVDPFIDLRLFFRLFCGFQFGQREARDQQAVDARLQLLVFIRRITTSITSFLFETVFQ
mgnify:CR=1 FL=1